jgi:hypothetical protein
MDKLIGHAVQKIMGSGEKEAPVKSIKLKVKFQKAKSEAIKRKHGKREK